MASLYEIDQAILNAVDSETGEIIDAEALDALLMQREDKLEAVACWIKNLQSDAHAIHDEINALAIREAKCRRKAESLKQYLASALQGEKFSTAKCAISFRRSERVAIQDEALVPKKFMKKTITYAPDKTAIKEAIQSGKTVNGCQLIENLNTQIK
jgi:hypothetical protein